jgi:hypothetical protein
MMNDEKDRHVLATAVTTEAEFVVTANLKDFPSGAVEAHGIEVRHSAEFLGHLFDLDQQRVLDVIRQQADDLNDPPITVDNLLNMLQSAGVPTFAQLVRRQLKAETP